jgi:uridine kinase
MIIGIAGGSGSGKSTLAITLTKKHPAKFVLLHEDDYYKSSASAPHLRDGRIDWDSPEGLRFDDLYRDAHLLQDGRSVTLLTKSELYNPTYDSELKNKMPITLNPAPHILIEGHLAFLDERLLQEMPIRIFLDIPIERSLPRRSSNKTKQDASYFADVLIPAHQKYVLPERDKATLILDATQPFEVVLKQAEEYLKANTVI